MVIRYCHQCSVSLGLLANVYTSEPLGTEYQLAKFMKHTVPREHYEAVSIFDSTSTGRYERHIVDASASGAVEIDDAGRRNIIWLAGERTGFRWEKGVLQGPQEGVKVVFSSESEKIHAFPIDVSALKTDNAPVAAGRSQLEVMKPGVTSRCSHGLRSK